MNQIELLKFNVLEIKSELESLTRRVNHLYFCLDWLDRDAEQRNAPDADGSGDDAVSQMNLDNINSPLNGQFHAPSATKPSRR